MKTNNRLVRTFILIAGCGSMAVAQAEVTRDIDYLPGSAYENNRDLLDIHMPEGADNVPVVVYFHGGALSAGSKEYGDGVAESAVARGIGFVSANYRLSPDVMHPAHVEDAAAATAWVIRNIDQYGGDPNNVYVSGHSAGAYLAALLAVDATHLDNQGIDPSRLQGSIPISPFLYVEETAAVRPKNVWGTVPSAWLDASVTHHVKADQGRILLIYADGDADWRKKQILRFEAAMQAAGNDDINAVEVPNRNHTTLVTNTDGEDDQVAGLLETFVR
jgi:acetyl esterase/lipase